MTSARAAAIASDNASIDASQSRAIAARQAEEGRPRNALEAMAQRLEITPAGLKKTLLNTVFAECKTEEQFMALIVVSNAYGLNPLTKEIYAFPAKGSAGIVPMVSVDGWIRLMNEHPQFNGIEFEYTVNQKGETVAIEAIIYRRDRDRPIKVMEFMEECKGNTLPWNKSPRRMLRHRALIQGVRIAFGFSGIAAEGDEEFVEAQYREVKPMPSRQTLAEELDDEIPAFDQQTGEIVDERPEPQPQGMTEVPEEAARELDSRSVAEQTLHEIDGPLEVEPEQAASQPFEWQDNVDTIKADAKAAMSRDALKAVEQDYLRVFGAWPKDICDGIEALFTQRRKELSAGA